MDAKIRHLLWKDIIDLVNENRVVILTSHNMAECEMLCDRIGIMEAGEFRCLGTPTELKQEHGTSTLYKIKIVKNNGINENVFSLDEFMKENFEACKLVESNTSELNEYRVNSAKLSQIFGKLEANRSLLAIKDYTISQTTLDDILLQL